MKPHITAESLFAAAEDRLGLQWVVHSKAARNRKLQLSNLRDNNNPTNNRIGDQQLPPSRQALSGYLNLVHPNQVQVLGREEQAHLDTLDAKSRWSTIANIMAHQPLAIVVADAQTVPPDLEETAAEARVALWRSPHSSYANVNFLQHYLSRQLAESTLLHGVFMEVFTIGVLITGESGCGKSELALELITRGHRLIADDAPEFTQISPDVVDGTCPEVLQDCLEVRGLGILNVRQMFGDAAVKSNKFLRLIINLNVPDNRQALTELDRLHAGTNSRRVLDTDIPQITLPVLAGRNLAVIVEAAVRDFSLKLKGIDAATEFIERHRLLLDEQNNS